MEGFRLPAMEKIIIFSVFKSFYFEDKINFNPNGNCSKISDTVISDCIKTFKKYANFHVRPQFSQITKTLFTLPVAILTFYTVKLELKMFISNMLTHTCLHLYILYVQTYIQ